MCWVLILNFTNLSRIYRKITSLRYVFRKRRRKEGNFGAFADPVFVFVRFFKTVELVTPVLDKV